MAVEVSLESPEQDGVSEDALEHALTLWRSARAAFERVDPKQVPDAARSAYFRALARIGIWADARVCAGREGEPDDAADEGEADSVDTSDTEG